MQLNANIRLDGSCLTFVPWHKGQCRLSVLQVMWDRLTRSGWENSTSRHGHKELARVDFFIILLWLMC